MKNKIISYACQSLGLQTMIMVALQNQQGDVRIYASICIDDLESDIKRTISYGQRIDNSDLFDINLNNFIPYEA